MKRSKSTSSGVTISRYPRRTDSKPKFDATNKDIQTLPLQTQACLGVLSFLASHEVPLDLLCGSGVAEPGDSLRFLNDERCRQDVLLQLQTTGLIEMDSPRRVLSVVPGAQMRKHMKNANLNDCQLWFDTAVQQLLRVTPRGDNEHISDSASRLDSKYILHALMVVKKFQTTQLLSDKLSPTPAFCRLVVNLAWHLFHTDTTNIVDDVIEIACSAVELHKRHHAFQLVYANLLTVMSLRALYLSAFEKAIDGFTQCLAIRHGQIKLPDDRHIEAESNLAIAYASQGLFERSFEHLQTARIILDRNKALEALELHSGEGTKVLAVPTTFSILLVETRAGSVHLAAGNINEAENLFQAALRLANDLKLEHWIISIQQSLARVYGRTCMLHRARHYIDSAMGHGRSLSDGPDVSADAQDFAFQYDSSNRDVLVTKGQYVLGWIMYKQGQFKKAIEALTQALMMMKAHSVPAAYQARATYILVKALEASGAAPAEVLEHKARAEALLVGVPRANCVVSYEEEKLEEEGGIYDLCLNVLDR